MENISAYVYSPKISVAILGIVVGFGVLSSRKNDLQHSKNDLQHNKNNLQHSKNDLQHSKNNLQHSKNNLQHNKNDLQHSKNNLQHNKNDLQHSKNNLQHSKNDLSSYRYGYLYKIILHLQHYLIKKKGGFYAKPGNKKRTSKTKRSYAELISHAELLTEALAANQEILPNALRGEFSKSLKKIVDEAKGLNVAQEKLKAALKEQTAQLDGIMKEIKKQYAEAKKRIKLDIKQELWKEFGIDDKR